MSVSESDDTAVHHRSHSTGTHACELRIEWDADDASSDVDERDSVSSDEVVSVEQIRDHLWQHNQTVLEAGLQNAIV